ncbi:MAG: VCBS repeat-containing protein, partial [Plectolyngbya sp. WJT66-NPBG17]|nr:VCBS repeat-containing protein [Plectolyngbya sp. WJT66-NPBG17]
MAIPDSLNPLGVPDFNGDGRTDLFSFNANIRTPEIMLMSGVRSLSSSSFSFTLDDWQDPEFGDFNGDRKTDSIWRNDKVGANAIWLMNGTAIESAAFLEPLQGAWTDVVGDFDGNGKSDLLWYNPNTGDYHVWLMDGLQRVKQTSGKIQQGWQATIADFNNDNRSDLFWRNPTTGENGVWTFDPQTLAIYGEFIPFIALLKHVRTMFEGSIDTIPEAVKLIPPLPHPILQHPPPMLN